jgi:uncharacterized protein with HEPN domain
MTRPPDDDLLRLRHMRDYGREATEFVRDAEQGDLAVNALLRHGLSYTLGIIGEVASHISGEFREAHPEIPWHQIIGMRNFLFHDYIGVSNTILWNTATIEVPRLLEVLDEILPDES